MGKVISIAALREERELGDAVRSYFGSDMSKTLTLAVLATLTEEEKEALREDQKDAKDQFPTHPAGGLIFVDEVNDRFIFPDGGSS